jgi:N-acetyl-1-D-myo-inositol-2-amino-2-deoxy-alpha-D-glucopyranoside deacetylase
MRARQVKPAAPESAAPVDASLRVMPDRRLLLVHAHPDDETIGTGATMARYVAQGVGVTLVTCTAGERGEVIPEGLRHLEGGDLGSYRRTELANAMAALGVADHRWLGGFGRYHDSGMQWHHDGHAVAADDTPPHAFARADLLEAADHLVAVVREVRPQVLVTYDDFGGYGHPDHVQAHRVATYAADLAAVRTHRPDLGPAHEIAKLYWISAGAEQLREGREALARAGTSFTVPDERLPRIARERADLDARIDAREFTEAKRRALAAHATQVAVEGGFFALSHNVGAAISGVEHYRLARGRRGPVGPDGLEEDLFAGLEDAGD